MREYLFRVLFGRYVLKRTRTWLIHVAGSVSPGSHGGEDGGLSPIGLRQPGGADMVIFHLYTSILYTSILNTSILNTSTIPYNTGIQYIVLSKKNTNTVFDGNSSSCH